MKRISTAPTVLPSTNMGAVGKAWDEVFIKLTASRRQDADYTSDSRSR
jgi:hypothetical protein